MVIDHNTTILIQIIILALGLVIGRYIVPYIKDKELIDDFGTAISNLRDYSKLISDLANKYVVYFEDTDMTGEDKFDACVAYIIDALKSVGNIEISAADEDIIKAAVQEAYENIYGQFALCNTCSCEEFTEE